MEKPRIEVQGNWSLVNGRSILWRADRLELTWINLDRGKPKWPYPPKNGNYIYGSLLPFPHTIYRIKETYIIYSFGRPYFQFGPEGFRHMDYPITYGRKWTKAERQYLLDNWHIWLRIENSYNKKWDFSPKNTSIEINYEGTRVGNLFVDAFNPVKDLFIRGKQWSRISG